jgi:hypothetical protein
MKTAIILVGNIRTWEKCRKNFIDSFGNEADIFLSTYNKQYAYHPYIQQSLNFDEDNNLSEEEIKEMFREIKLSDCIIDDIETYVEEKVKPFICNKFPKDSHLSLSQYFKLNDGLNLIKKQEEVRGFKYDRIIKTRFDIIHNPITGIKNNNSVYVDAHGAGVFPCDWIFISNRDNAYSINNFIIREIKDMKNETSIIDMPHKLFLNGIKASGGNILPVSLIRTIVRASMKNQNLEIKNEIR